MGDELADHVTCCICMDLYDDPVALPCMHSFCKRCIVGIVASALVLKCPECRKDTKLGKKGVEGLVRNFQLGSIVESYKREHESRLSAQRERQERLPQCRQHKVMCELTCKSCKKSVCFRCLTEKHNGHTFEMPDTDTPCDQELGGSLCDQHCRTYKLSCKTCDTLACVECVITHHQGHTFLPAEDLLNFAMDTVNNSLLELEAKGRQLRATHKTCRTLAQKVQMDAQRKRQEVSSYFARLKDIVDRREATIKAELDKLETSAVDKYRSKADMAQRKDVELSNIITDVKRLLTEDKVHVLQTYKARTSRATSLLNEDSSCPPEVPNIDEGDLITCDLDKELAKVKWKWPSIEIKKSHPTGKVAPIPPNSIPNNVRNAPSSQHAPQGRPPPQTTQGTSLQRTTQGRSLQQTSQDRQLLQIGCPVQRGKDWSDGSTDGGPRHFGTVLQTTVEQHVYLVRWPNGKTGNYKYEPPHEEQIVPAFLS